MSYSYYPAATLDDLMRNVFSDILSHGGTIHPSKGEALELTGVLLELTNPRARLSRSETRGKPFSSLGELSWYLARTNELDFIKYYLPQYREFAENNIIYGGYGPRFFQWKGVNQFENVIALLRRRPATRQAIIQLFDSTDLIGAHKDVPCTCTLQFMLRNDKLNMLASMRSNDAFGGLPHDIFSFTMFQEIIARTLGVDVGTYKHSVGSLHIYSKNIDDAKEFLDEGWQSKISMPKMPIGDPWPAIEIFLDVERAVRTGVDSDGEGHKNLDPYWTDLIYLLRIFRYKKENNVINIKLLLDSMSSPTYRPFIEKILAQLPSKQ